jgi:hypothetical protein
MSCNAHESAKIIKIYYLSLEYNFPSRNSENLGFPDSVKEFKGQGVLGSSYQTRSKLEMSMGTRNPPARGEFPY